MLRCMDSAVAGLRAHQNKMDVVGNNIANVNTVGFKAQTYTFQDAMYQTSSASTGGTDRAGGTNAAQYGYGALMGSIGMDMTASTPFYASGLNATINGEGFFITCATKSKSATATGPENIAPNALKSGLDWDFTRVGQFQIDSEGYLTDAQGNYVFGFAPNAYDATNKTIKFDMAKIVPLRVPTAVDANKLGSFSDWGADSGISTNVSINSLGEVSATVRIGDVTHADVSLGKIAIATFQNPNGLTKAGGNYFKAKEGDNTGDAVAAIAGGDVPTLMAGYLEASNVDLAQEFSDMITTHRGFQANSKMITVGDEMLSDLVSMKR